MTKLLLPALALASGSWLVACATPRDTVAETEDRYSKYEAPQHETVVQDGPFEMRRYRPYVVAKTTVAAADFGKASNEGFRRIAGYIFGGNQGARDIAMTVPVTAERASSSAGGEKIAMTVPVGAAESDDGWSITFMMPRQYSLETLPVPNDPRVEFEQVEGQCRAAVRFSWLATEANIEKHTAELRAWANARGLKLTGAPIVARYDDPLTLPWNRTNEVWLDVENADDACAAIG